MVARRNPDDLDEKLERWAAEREARLQVIEGILAATPAIGGRFHNQSRMVLKTPEVSDRQYGAWRVTFFGPDGPHGHATRATERELAEAVLDFMHEPFTAMADADVADFTSTETFERGSRIIAIVQAENTLRYLAGRAGRYDWAREVIRDHNLDFQTATYDQLDAEAARLSKAIKSLPVQNPGRARGSFVTNPPWVTGILANHYELLEKKVPPAWMPQLQGVTARRNKLTASLTEYGCGAYGCVLATNDPLVVLKVTTDDTEAEFAATMANQLVAPICVVYQMAIRLATQVGGSAVQLLWREAADHVGKLKTAFPDGALAVQLIDEQHAAATQAYITLMMNAPAAQVGRRIDAWLDTLETIKRSGVRELVPLATGMLEVWHKQRVLFGDVHAGNLGFVPTRKRWVITDPGNIAVVGPMTATTRR